MLLPPLTDPASPVRRASGLRRGAYEWVWRDRLAVGKLAMLDGDPEQGKSLVAMDLCARVTTGRAMPDGSAGIEASHCLILQEEDGAEDTVVERLRTHGADLDRVFFWNPLDEFDRPMRIPANLNLLEEAMQQCDARMLIVDPVMAFLDPSIAVCSDQGVRRALSPLARLARKRRCLVLLVRHLNKQHYSHALYRGGGSIGLIAACRSGWLIGRDPHNRRRRVLAQSKNNLAGPQPSLAYDVQATEQGTPVISWAGPSPWQAAQLLAAAARQACPERDRAREFILEFLDLGPRLAREVWAAADKAGHAVRTMRRAKAELGVRSPKVRTEGLDRVWWLLPGQEPPRDDHADSEMFKMLAEQERKYPPATPLDR